MNETAQLIRQFWDGNLSTADCQRLLELLNSNDPAITDSLRNAFFKMKEDGKIVLEKERSQRIFNVIYASMEEPGPEAPWAAVKQMTFWKRRAWQVAAAVIFMLGSAIALQQVIRSSTKVTPGASAAAQLKNIVNNHDTAITTRLKDGSVIVLEPHSALSYYTSYGDVARKISLSGKALFTVAKDSLKPFTVYASGIATTALGTVFTISTREPDSIEVILYEGKVVIKPGDNNKQLVMPPVFLLSGQTFIANRLTNKYIVRNVELNKAVPPSSKTIPQFIDSASLSFTNASLASVFRRLSKRYNVNIRIDSGDIAELYFTGTVLSSDSLQTVLSAICNSNQLTFSSHHGHILIQKLN